MKKVLSLILCIILLFGITGCGNKKEEINKYQIKEEKIGIIVVTDDKKVNEKTKINVKEDKNDYRDINENINKYVAYDISLSNDDNIVNIKNKTEVYLKIPNDYDKEKLVVYYILDKEIKETFNVKVVEKDKENYAMFETDHFSIYVLAELKEQTTQESVKENEIEEDSKVKEEIEDKSKDNNKNNTNQNTTTNKNNNTSSNSDSNNNGGNNSSSTSTINLVGNWKHESSNTYYTFKNDYSGILYVNATDDTVKYTFVWGYQDGTLSIKYNDSGMGSTKNKIKIYNQNKIDIQPSKGFIYNRYYGEITVNKITQKNLTFKVKYINMPSGLEFQNNQSSSETWYVKTTNESLLNNTYTVTYDLSNCTADSCSVMPTFDTPKEIEFSSSVVARSINLRKIRYYGDLYCDVVYTNFDNNRYNIDLQGKVFRVDVYSENQSDLNNSKCQATVNMSNCVVGNCSVEAKYTITSGNAVVSNPYLQDTFTILLTEK